MGANLIDFQDNNIEKKWNEFIPEKMRTKLFKIQDSFLLFENDQIRKGDYEKDRYYYRGGFYDTIKAFEKQLQQNDINLIKGAEIETVEEKQGKVQLNNEQFDKVILALPVSQIKSLFDNYPNKRIE